MEISDISPEAKARRVKTVRTYIGLTRAALYKKYNIQTSTLRKWETPKPGSVGLTPKGANRLVEILFKEGLFCTEEWLLTGEGEQPQFTATKNEILMEEINRSFEIFENNAAEIQEEIQLFKKKHKDNIVLAVRDHHMQPAYKIGDYVGGKKIDNNFPKYFNKDCIILYDGKSIVGRISPCHNSNNLYNIYTIDAEYDIITSVKVDFLAPIIRVWRGGT